MTFSSLLPPSARLPPVRQIADQPIDVLINLVEDLRVLYNPPVRGQRRLNRRKSLKQNPGDLSCVETEEQLRTDEFERAHAVRWLTGLVAQSSMFEGSLADDETHAKLDRLICSASALIAACAGTAAARTLTRRFTFPCPSDGEAIEVQLTDVPISADEELPTVGTQTWGSARLLAEMLAEDPGRFGLAEAAAAGGGGGSGLALVKALSARHEAVPVARVAVEVVASDYHPAVLENLQRNVEANFPGGTPPHVSLTVAALDWSEFSTSFPPDLEMFDVVLGADVVYEPTHAEWVRGCVSALLRRPSSSSALAQPRFHLVMPLRPTHAFESRAVEEAFPPSLYDGPSLNGTSEDPRSRLCVLEKETIVCEGEDPGTHREVEYVHYVISWV
ncbi:hypothetical protein C8Q80DRAFT_1222471 [Daedaleopsis nitida]|nr:hypothetical protein C8Q80DRAFT_1222471 [Daedaleopsis nitida]